MPSRWLQGANCSECQVRSRPEQNDPYAEAAETVLISAGVSSSFSALGKDSCGSSAALKHESKSNGLVRQHREQLLMSASKGNRHEWA